MGIKKETLVLIAALLYAAAVVLLSNITASRGESVYEPVRRATRSAVTEADGRRVIDINIADEDILVTLRGIGPSLASRIVEYREAHGPFSSLDALTEVKGIGEATVESLRGEAFAGEKTQ